MCPYIQTIWAKIRTPHDEFLLGLCYNRPNSTSEQIDSMNKNIERENKTHENMIICGYFNFPGINCETVKSKKKSERFLKTAMYCFLTQHVHDLTRTDNTLDIILELPLGRDSVRTCWWHSAKFLSISD